MGTCVGKYLDGIIITEEWLGTYIICVDGIGDGMYILGICTGDVTVWWIAVGTEITFDVGTDVGINVEGIIMIDGWFGTVMI